MWSPDKELTIVVFIDPYCGIDYNLVKTLRDINFSWEKVDICSSNDTIYDKEFDRQSMESSQRHCPNITFCFCEGDDLTRAQLARRQYVNKWEKHSYTRTMVFTDKNGVVKDVPCDMKRADKDRIIDRIVSMGFGDLIQPQTDTREVECPYGQTNAREMLARINQFRTGNDAWEWDSSTQRKVYHTSLQPLTYDYELEKAAMQRAAEIVAYYGHERPDNSSYTSSYDDKFLSATNTGGENIAAMYSNNENDVLELLEPLAGKWHFSFSPTSFIQKGQSEIGKNCPAAYSPGCLT